MHDRMSCTRCQELLPAYLTGAMTAWEMAGLRTHLNGCLSCRAHLAGYFPVEQWEEQALATGHVSNDFTRSVMAALAGEDPRHGRVLANPTGANRKTAHGRRLLWNYLLAACATLVLVFTNCFSIFTGLAGQADRLNEKARAINLRTRQLTEVRLDWQAVWTRITTWSGPDLKSTEGSGNHAKE